MSPSRNKRTREENARKFGKFAARRAYYYHSIGFSSEKYINVDKRRDTYERKTHVTSTRTDLENSAYTYMRMYIRICTYHTYVHFQWIIHNIKWKMSHFLTSISNNDDTKRYIIWTATSILLYINTTVLKILCLSRLHSMYWAATNHFRLTSCYKKIKGK